MKLSLGLHFIDLCTAFQHNFNSASNVAKFSYWEK